MGRKKRNRKTAALRMAWFMDLLLMLPVRVSASDVATITKKIDNLYTLVVGIITAAGMIVLAWGVFEFAAGYQAHDTPTQTAALKKVISGLLMVLAKTVINLLTT